MESKYLKAWLNYNCVQGNNWIMIYQFDQIVNHKDRQCFKTNGKSTVPLPLDKYPILTSLDLKHVYFTYMTEDQLISLFETRNRQLYLIYNQMKLTEPETVDDVKVDDIAPMPQIESIVSKLIHIDNIKNLTSCLSRKERKIIGIQDNSWLNGQLKKHQQDELQQVSFLDFIHLQTEEQYVSLLNQYINQSGETLNLTHNYSVTSSLLNQVIPNPNIKQLIMNQNFQITDFQWLQKFPNLKLLNFFYNHQMEQVHFEQIVEVVPHLQVINIHFCVRINIRILLPLLKLRELEKIAIEDTQFWCQKGVHELFITPSEWKNIFCPSLHKVAINSHNLTLDVIDYLLLACPNVQLLTVDEEVLKSINKNVESGCDQDDPIVFNAWQNPQKGVKVYKKINFKNLMKNNYNSQMFSNSMLKKIKDIKTNKGEKEQTPLQ
jgi:hypothetical protein